MVKNCDVKTICTSIFPSLIIYLVKRLKEVVSCLETVSYRGDTEQSLLQTYNMKVLNGNHDYEGLISLLYSRS